MSSLRNAETGTRFALDTPEPIRLNSREYYVKGWFIPGTSADSPKELSILVDGVARPVYCGLNRPDVGRYFGEPALSNCGYIARFKAPRAEPIISLVARSETVGDVLLDRVTVALQDTRAADRSGKLSTYDEWLSEAEPALFWADDEVFDRLSALLYHPLISVVLPTYNTDLYFLTRCIESVLEQKYALWELCVVDDCSTEPQVIEYLQRIAGRDPRVHITRRDKQGGISAASNMALQVAQGEFIVLLDHDDELHPFALLEIVKHTNSHDRVDLIYSDEDKIDGYGRRAHPAFKPDFDLDIFLSFNYLGHLIALRRSVALGIGGFRTICDGAQDWDLLVRAVEVIGPEAVHHIQKPLYHWRMHTESTAYSLDAKPYAREAWATVLSGHIERTGKKAGVEPGLFDGSMRIRWQRPQNVRLAVFLRAEDGALQQAALEPHLDRRWMTLYELIDCVIHRTGRREKMAGAGSGGGEAISHSSIYSLSEMTEDVFVFINRPLETVNHFFFDELTAQATRPDCGLVTGISLDTERRIVHSGFVRGPSGNLVDPFAGTQLSESTYMGQLRVVRNVETITDEFFAVRREYLAAVGGLGLVSANQMLRLVGKLAENAQKEGMRILVTPFTIGTFDGAVPRQPAEPARSDSHAPVRLNSNFAVFENPRQILQCGI